MERIITLYVNPKQVVLANDRTLAADENGVIELHVDELLVSGDKGIPEYDRLLTEVLSYEQRESLYFMFLNNSRFGIQDTMNMLGVERRIAKDILDLGMRLHVLKKIDTQRKMIPDLKETVQAHINTMKRIKNQPKEEPKLEDKLPVIPVVKDKTISIPKKKGK